MAGRRGERNVERSIKRRIAVERAIGGDDSLAALGVVFGDIATSPLYTFKTVLDYTGHIPIRGRFSARCAHYLDPRARHYRQIRQHSHAMDNDGEGGILA